MLKIELVSDWSIFKTIYEFDFCENNDKNDFLWFIFITSYNNLRYKGFMKRKKNAEI